MNVDEEAEDEWKARNSTDVQCNRNRSVMCVFAECFCSSQAEREKRAEEERAKRVRTIAELEQRTILLVISS